MTFQHLFQYLVIKTSVPPLSPLYHSVYALALRHIVWRLRRTPGVEAIYLKGGMARGEILPGISDIDLLIFVQPEARNTAETICKQCAALFPMFRNGYGLRTRSEFRRYLLYNATDRFLCDSTISSCKRLFGVDVLSDYRKPDPESLHFGYCLEMQSWWTHFYREAFWAPRSKRDSAWQLSIGYKTIAEIARLYRALKTDRYLQHREQGLLEGRCWLDAEGQALAQRALEHRESRFLKDDPAFCDDVLRYMARFLTQLYGVEIPQMASARAAKNLPQCVDGSPDEMRVSALEHNAIYSVLETAKTHWGVCYLGASLTPSAFYGADSLILTLHVNPSKLPPREKLALVIAQIATAQRGLNRGINLHLGLPSLSLRLFSRDEGRQSRHGVLSRSLFSDSLSIWAQPGFLLEGIASETETPVRTAWQEECLLNWRCQRSWLPASGLPDSLPANISPFMFVCAWWKALQFLMIERSIRLGEVVYPLTIAAISRALERADIRLPSTLRELEEAFACGVEGHPFDISERVPEALAFLRDVNKIVLEI